MSSPNEEDDIPWWKKLTGTDADIYNVQSQSPRPRNLHEETLLGAAIDEWAGVRPESRNRPGPSNAVPPAGGKYFGYQHLGPGNSIEDYTKNALDGLAKAHDIAYNNAKSDGDVRKADDVFIKNTFNHALNPDVPLQERLLSAGSSAAIAGKRAGESIVGVKYPKIAKQNFPKPNYFGNMQSGSPKSASQWIYGIQRTAHNKKFKTTEEYNAFLKSEHEKLRSKMGEDNYYHTFENYKNPNILRRVTSTAAPIDNSLDIDNDLLANLQIPSPPVDHATAPVTDNATPSNVIESPITSADNVTTSTSSSTTQVTPNSNVAMYSDKMDTDAAVSSTDDVSGSTPGASGGSGIAVQSLQFYRAPSNYSWSNIQVYKNSFRCRSWGSATHVMNWPVKRSTTALGGVAFVLPYAAFPAHKVCSYIPYALFEKFRAMACVKIIGVKVKVTPIGQMVSFNANSSASAVGTTSHTLYGSSGIGLNKNLPCLYADTLSRQDDSPMILTSAKISPNPTWHPLIWGTNRESSSTVDEATSANTITSLKSAALNNTIFEVPTVLGIYQGSAKPLTTGTAFKDLHIIETTDSFHQLNKYITTYPMQPHTGQPCINYTHIIPPLYRTRFRGGAAGTSQVYVDYSLADRVTTGTNDENVGIRTVNSVNVGTTSGSIVWGGYNANIEPSVKPNASRMFLPNNTDTYQKMCIQMNTVRSHGKCVGNAEPEIPNIFFGIEAVRSNTPDTVASFVNASCDFYVETELCYEISDKFDLPHDSEKLYISGSEGVIDEFINEDSDRHGYPFRGPNNLLTQIKTLS